MKLKYFSIFAIPFFAVGCLNMPTKPAEVTGAYVSPVKYQNYTCEQLITELNSLSRRENSLVSAQNQRIKTSQVQAFWHGYGQGDSVEVTELANVRGEKEAIKTSLEKKSCKSPILDLKN